MRATYLGSNPLTALLRCACGRKLYFDKETWETLGFLRCDNCGSKICYDLRVISPLTGRVHMEKDKSAEGTDASYVDTPERREIVETLRRGVELLHRRAEAHKKARSELRTHRALNRAQQVQGVVDLLAMDWHEDDMAARQGGERAA